MHDESQIRAKLEKIKALFNGATTDGEQLAARAAMGRLQQRIEGIDAELRASDPPEEYQFSVRNPWSMRLFLALCRSKGLKPYRYPRMHRTSICIRVGKHHLDSNLWPEFEQMNDVLTRHLNELADSIISECINPDDSDAEVVKEIATS